MISELRKIKLSYSDGPNTIHVSTAQQFYAALRQNKEPIFDRFRFVSNIKAIDSLADKLSYNSICSIRPESMPVFSYKTLNTFSEKCAGTELAKGIREAVAYKFVREKIETDEINVMSGLISRQKIRTVLQIKGNAASTTFLNENNLNNPDNRKSPINYNDFIEVLIKIYTGDDGSFIRNSYLRQLELVTVKQFADLLGVTTSVVRRQIKNGKIHSFAISQRLTLISVREVRDDA